MVTLGIEWVCIVVTVWQETFASTRQFRDFKMTPSDHELIGIIDYIHNKGMKVQLRPMLQGWDGSFRMTILFPQESEMPVFLEKKLDYWTRWFDSFIERTLHYCAIAQATGCEAYGLDSGLDYTVCLNDHWKQVIAVARDAYSGHLTTGHTMAVDFLEVLNERPDHWLRELDSLGISFYPPLGESAPGIKKISRITASTPPARIHSSPDSEEMKVWLDGPREYLAEIARRLAKPVYFSECGIRSSTAGAFSGSGTVTDDGGQYDGTVQAYFLDSILHSFWNEPWWMGMYWWKWDEHIDRPHFRSDPRGDQGLTIWGKPAADVMKRWYSRSDRR